MTVSLQGILEMTTPIDIVRSFYDALDHGDATAALDLLSVDMEWNVVAGWPYKPTGLGPQAVAEGVLMPVLKEWRDYKLHGNDMFVAGDRVVSMGVMTGIHALNGKALKAAYVHVWETAGDKIIRLRQTVDTAPVVAARSLQSIE
jgi:ketosteroid isomerase-like protein